MEIFAKLVQWKYPHIAKPKLRSIRGNACTISFLLLKHRPITNLIRITGGREQLNDKLGIGWYINIDLAKADINDHIISIISAVLSKIPYR